MQLQSTENFKLCELNYDIGSIGSFLNALVCKRKVNFTGLF